MRIIEIHLRSFPRRLRTSRPPPSPPSHSSTFYSSDIDIDIDNRQRQRSDSDSTSSSSSYMIECARLRPRRTYWETGRGGMNPHPHWNRFSSWFHRGVLPTRRTTNLPRREQTHRAFVVDPPEDTRARHRRRSPVPPASRAPLVSRARPSSLRMDSTFAQSRVRPPSRSRDRDVHETCGVREVHREAPRRENHRSAPAPRVRPVSPRVEFSFTGLRGRSRSSSRVPQETSEVREARPTGPDTRHIPPQNVRPPRERTPVGEREPRRSGRWISPVRQGRIRRLSPPLDRRPDPQVASTDEDASVQPAVPRPIVRGPSGARGIVTGEERRTMPSRIPSPITDNLGRSKEEPTPRRTVQRSPQPQPRPGAIEERRPRTERPEIIHYGRRGLSDSAERFVHGNQAGDAPRVRVQETPSRFSEPQVTRVFRRRRNRQERFIDERGPLDRWR